MQNQLTAIIEKDVDWYIAYCPEISGANEQDRKQDGLRYLPKEAIREINALA